MNNSDSQQSNTFSNSLESAAPPSASPIRRVLITGASGAVGCAVANRFWQGGCRVRILDQMPFPEKYSDTQPELFRGDITDPDLLRAAVKDVDLVVHMAAKLHINNPEPSLRAEYKRVNVEGTQRLVSAASEAKVPRFIYLRLWPQRSAGDSRREVAGESRFMVCGNQVRGGTDRTAKHARRRPAPRSHIWTANERKLSSPIACVA